MSFDKEAFKTRLDQMIRTAHASSAQILKKYGDKEGDMLSNFFLSCGARILWETRNSQYITVGIDAPEAFQCFAKMLTIGLNQLNVSINQVQDGGYPVTISLTKINLLIKSQVEALADDTEELINSIHCYG